MRRLTVALILVTPAGLSGCIPAAAIIGAVGTAAVVGRDVYCTGVSDAGHQAVRAALTGGHQVIACPERAPPPPEARP
jgi:hypothetical protein